MSERVSAPGYTLLSPEDSLHHHAYSPSTLLSHYPFVPLSLLRVWRMDKEREEEE